MKRVLLRIFYFLFLLQFSILAEEYVGLIEHIDGNLEMLMTGRSWKNDCPVPLEDLRYLTMSYFGFDEKVHQGNMVVHVKVALEIIEIFKEIFDAQFPIEQMRLIDYCFDDVGFDDSMADERSMADNNSSAFCSRAITNKPGKFSIHSYGLAVDVNPLLNPYVKGDFVTPPDGQMFVERELCIQKKVQGLIFSSMNNPCYRAFTRRGWEWGGSWKRLQDYHHFQKDPKKFGLA